MWIQMKNRFFKLIRNCTHSDTLGLQPIRIDVDAIRTGNSHQRTNKFKSKKENICLRNRYVYVYVVYFLVAFICFFFTVIGKLNDFFSLLFFIFHNDPKRFGNGSLCRHCRGAHFLIFVFIYFHR